MGRHRCQVSRWIPRALSEVTAPSQSLSNVKPNLRSHDASDSLSTRHPAQFGMPLDALVSLIETTTTEETNSMLALRAPTLTERKKDISNLVTEAAINDDVELIARCIELASHINTDYLNWTLYKGLKRAVHREALNMISYVLDHGANIQNVDGHTVTSQPDEVSYKLPSLKVVKCLLARGLDINADSLLLWCVQSDHFWVVWCLAHGATVEGSLDAHGNPQRPILEFAASASNIETFELLRSKGAGVSRGVLPSAVRVASHLAPKNASDVPSARYKNRLAMVSYLIDSVGIDVNLMSWGVGAGVMSGSPCSTPLCCIGHASQNETSELVWLLLDRGGDPDLHYTYSYDGSPEIRIDSVLEAHADNVLFRKAVEDWRKAKRGATGQETG